MPADIDPYAAVFLANMETAVNFLLDASPKVGERVLIVGQGIVGLLTSGLLAQFPLAGLFAVESIADRQRWAEQSGVNRVFDINQPDELAELHNVLRPNEQYGGADLIIEVSGSLRRSIWRLICAAMRADSGRQLVRHQACCNQSGRALSSQSNADCLVSGELYRA